VQANNRFNRADCCHIPTPDACVLGGWPEFTKYGFTFKRTDSTALGWDELRSQLAPAGSACKFAPVAFSWRWIGGGGHMMVATGYTTDASGRRYIYINDPWEPNVGATRTILYDVYDELPGQHTHWDDYYDIKRP
jgi:Papain-like cysteine protease AvrRpt2